ncbi:HAD family hydrolase [Vibrio sp. 10N.286.49.C2]|uniref:HAD-IA family hydrolase n=1 Tax=unclassified Vibrio TaxID=2614977 RepID=UPI000C865B9E|nr:MULTISPECIES: HAD-IA family hydrolase [unclassified Vibrio]PMH38267.1 HAD family hydrolase [Vibrio sp. 10N.286.49.C2]PMH55675.1 HAD family hydrolase [Vibrio sp. 10N.286.49.B1]PMH83937.1 HAD family hydrolase [Vibrio sp. 10N.286.48.B7]
MTVVKCVLFDCDGTLVDSEMLCCDALVATFKEVGVTLPLTVVSEDFTGGKIADVLMSAQQAAGSRVSLDILEPIYRRITTELFESKLTPIDGVELLLDYLDSEGVEYCVVTNSPTHKAIHMLTIVGLADRFKGRVISAFDANSWKPEPDLLRYAVTMMGFLPNECVYIDDTIKGVTMGVATDINTIHFAKVCHIKQSNVVCLTAMDQVVDYISDLNGSVHHAVSS